MFLIGVSLQIKGKETELDSLKNKNTLLEAQIKETQEKNKLEIEELQVGISLWSIALVGLFIFL